MATTSSIPSGCIMAFAGTTVPVGWLLCDGSQISRTTYVGLFNAVGTVHGAGNGTTTFHLPDYRGRFLRGRDGGAARDPDRATRTASNAGGATADNVGSVQDDIYGSHFHPFTAKQETNSGGNAGVSSGSAGGIVYTNQFNTASVGGNETRPKNSNVLYIIKE